MRNIGFLVIVLGLLAGCSVEKKATKAFRYGKYQTAIDIFRDQLKKNPNDGRANYFVAESYRLSNRLKEAEPFYEKAGGRGIDADSVKFFYAQSLEVNGKYDAARKVLQAVLADATAEQIKERAEAELTGLDKLQELNQQESFYRVKNLELVNSPAAEYSPVYLNDELYFTSSRGGDKVYEATGTPFTDIFKVASRGAIVDLATLEDLLEVMARA